MRVIHHQSTVAHRPLEVKKVSIPSVSETNSEQAEAAVSEEIASSPENISEVPVSSEETSQERRTRRAAEYKEAAQIRDRALAQMKQVEAKMKEMERFQSLMEKAKEDPTLVAKALNMDPTEFLRKYHNTMFNLKPEETKEKTFEERTKEKLELYDKEREQEKERRAQEAKEYAQRNAEMVKSNYIRDHILPAITSDHELIQANGKDHCASLIYDLMNRIYVDCANNNKPFEVTPLDAINEMEETLFKTAEDQISSIKKLNKMKKHFAAEEQEQRERDIDLPSQRESSDLGINRKDFKKRVNTLSNNLGSSVPPSSVMGNPAPRKIPLKNRDARREQAKKMLGQA